MTVIPQNNYVLCEQLVKDNEQVNEHIIYNKTQVPVYKIVDVSKSLDDFRFTVGDKIICNSTGTKVVLDNSVHYLFNIENIIGKIV